MSKNVIRKRIDLTNLSTTANAETINNLCKRALNYGTATVCIAPCWVKYVSERYSYLNLKICTVIGFPNGYNSSSVKVFETEQAIDDGADEIDVVVNQSWIKNGLWRNITKELEEIRRVSAGKAVMKVIFETCNLTPYEIHKLCQICINVGVDYVKTSTGFAKEGASEKAVRCMYLSVKDSPVKIKAAGGIRTFDTAEKYIDDFGCDRIGTSSLDVIKFDEGEEIHITKCEYNKVDLIAEVVFSDDGTIIANITKGEYSKKTVCLYDTVDEFRAL